MKKTAYLLLIVFVSGCASFQPSIPEGYAGHTATIEDTYSNHTGSTAHFYVLSKIDDKLIMDSGYKTRVVNSGRGFNMTPQMLSREVTTDSHLFTLVGFVQFATDGQGLFGDSMMVKKSLRLTPEPGMLYRVTGELSKSGSDIWLEDSNGNKFLGTTITK